MRLLLTTFLIFTNTFLFSQSFEVSSFFIETDKNGKIEGVVLDNEVDNGPLAFATITVKNTAFETNSDLDGSFSFNLKPGKYILEVQFLGYATVELRNVEVVAGNTLSIEQKLKVLTLNADISMAN
ncbi:MAG: carboxypeptidase-like regulatory domain-containing protein [Lutibacter sp.]|nr:carboxypeptidase-like regulatory domain-containing protein [Lutibacter sp.]MDT8417705.1 carboxypeptidase-like regulatory domain-containing protein [Lutibacter sp.]